MRKRACSVVSLRNKQYYVRVKQRIPWDTIHGDIDDTEIDELIRIKLLKEETRNEKQAIIDAFYEFLEHTLDAAA